jgi:hypothetical protein
MVFCVTAVTDGFILTNVVRQQGQDTREGMGLSYVYFKQQ